MGMYRRISIILTVLAALSFAPFAAHADSKGDAFAAKVASQLKELGYSTVEVSRTFLGRIRVEATGSAGEREIIFNPALVRYCETFQNLDMAGS